MPVSIDLEVGLRVRVSRLTDEAEDGVLFFEYLRLFV